MPQPLINNHVASQPVQSRTPIVQYAQPLHNSNPQFILEGSHILQLQTSQNEQIGIPQSSTGAAGNIFDNAGMNVSYPQQLGQERLVTVFGSQSAMDAEQPLAERSTQNGQQSGNWPGRLDNFLDSRDDPSNNWPRAGQLLAEGPSLGSQQSSSWQGRLGNFLDSRQDPSEWRSADQPLVENSTPDSQQSDKWRGRLGDFLDKRQDPSDNWLSADQPLIQRPSLGSQQSDSW